MTLQEFKKNITRSSRLAKPFYYFISFIFIGVGLNFLYLAFFDKVRQQAIDLQFSRFSTALFFLFLGGLLLYLIPNRYKVLKIHSKASAEKKKKVIADTMQDFGSSFLDNPKQFWSFNYR